MSRLLIEELKTTLTQKITFGLERRNVIRAICPYLFLNNAPAGTFTLKIKNEADIAVWSKSFTSEMIKDSLETESNNLRVYYPIVINPYLILGKGSYEFSLEAQDYSYNRNSFLGWVKEYENEVKNVSYEVNNDAERPLSIRIKVLKEGIE